MTATMTMISIFRSPQSKQRKESKRGKARRWKPLLLLYIIKLFPQDLVHGEHMNLILFEHQLHLLVAPDLAFIVRVLQVARFDVLPYLLDCLGARELHS